METTMIGKHARAVRDLFWVQTVPVQQDDVFGDKVPTLGP